MDANLVQVAAGQVLILFLLILVGFAFTKLGAVKEEGRIAFSDLLINVVMPAMIINSFLIGYDPDVSANLFRTLIASIAAMLISILISSLVWAKDKDSQVQILKFASAFCNCGYMGFPFISALFGTEGLLYASIFNAVYNLFTWTVGVRMIERNRSGLGFFSMLKDFIKKPPLIAVAIGLILYFGRISLPEFIAQPIALIGDMNTPLAMFITGMLLAGGGLLKALRNSRVWRVVLTRLVLIPIIVLAFSMLVGIRGVVGAVVVLLIACPTASNTSVFTVKYRYEESLGASTVVVTTLLSILTLPLFAGIISLAF